MSLAGNIHQLTENYLTMASGKAVKMPSLLEQLDIAMTDKNGRTGGGGGVALPISDAAVSLRQDIEWQVRNEQYQRTGSDVGAIVDILKSWVHEADEQMAYYLEHITLDWCDQITAMVNPVKPPWRPAIPCPACGVLYDRNGNGPGMRVHCWGDDEDLLHPGEWTAECIHCGAKWEGENMPWLSHAIGVAS